MTTLRLPYYELSSDVYKALILANNQLSKSVLGAQFINLIYLRVSQINSCSFCLEMHGKDLRKQAETEIRLDTLAGWQLSEHFNTREKAALAWAESLTMISQTLAPDTIYSALKMHFNDTEISDLTCAISLMNCFNRLAISMRQ